MPAAKKKTVLAVRKKAKGRRPKSAVVEEPCEVKKPLPTAPHMRLVGASSEVFDESPPAPQHEPDPLRPDRDLDTAQRAEFAKLLNTKFPLAERVDRLVALAHKDCTKTAAVGLRAITIINEITGVTEDVDKDAPAMFSLPEGATISVEVETPDR
jgi:hypothetical protein